MKLPKPTPRLLIIAAINISFWLIPFFIFEAKAEDIRLVFAAGYVLFILLKGYASAVALEAVVLRVWNRLAPAREAIRLRVTSSTLYSRFTKAA